MWKKAANSQIEMPESCERNVFEALVNALIHRDYTILGSEVHIDIYDDRLTIYSPGGMADGTRVQERDISNISSTRRNPMLADIFGRTDITAITGYSATAAGNLINKTKDAGLIEAVSSLGTQLIPTLLDVVDEGRIGMRPAVELSYLSKDEQSALADVMSYMDCTPSHDQAIRMRKMSEDGKLTPEVIEAIMGEAKPNQREKISFRADRLRQYIPKNISPSQTEDYVMKALEHYSRYLEQVKRRNEAR